MTSTTTSTLAGIGTTTIYQTFTQVTSVPNMTAATYTTTEEYAVPVEVTVTTVAQTTIYGDIHYTTITSVGEYYYYTQLEGAVTSQYSTNVPTTMFSTAATTSTYTTMQTTNITNTQSGTAAGPNVSNLEWVIAGAILGGTALAVAIKTVENQMEDIKNKRQEASTSFQQTPTTCVKCGAKLPPGFPFCSKCGTKQP